MCDQVIRADQLIECIRGLDAGKSWVDSAESFGEMEDRAALWLSKNVLQKSDLPARYGIDAPAHKADPAEVGPRRKTVAVWDGRGAGAGGSDVPMCPLCGAPMVERVARYGKRRGKRFWGCSAYGQTRCKGIVSIDD